MQNENEVVIDRTLVNKFALHKLAENGGSIKFNHFGIRIVYNPDQPNRPMVEARLFAVPIGTIYKGNINPSLAKMAKKKEAAEEFKIEESEEIEM